MECIAHGVIWDWELYAAKHITSNQQGSIIGTHMRKVKEICSIVRVLLTNGLPNFHILDRLWIQ